MDGSSGGSETNTSEGMRENRRTPTQYGGSSGSGGLGAGEGTMAPAEATRTGKKRRRFVIPKSEESGIEAAAEEGSSSKE